MRPPARRCPGARLGGVVRRGVRATRGHDDVVGARGDRGVVGDQQRRAPAARPRDRRADRGGGLGVEVRGRLVEDHERRRRAGTRAPARSRCAWPAESPRPPSPIARVEALAAARRAAPRAPAARPREDPLARGAGVGRARCSRRSCRRTGVVRWGTQATRARQARARASRRSTPPQLTARRLDRRAASRARRRVLLPAPLGPTSAVRPRARASRSRSCRASAARSG